MALLAFCGFEDNYAQEIPTAGATILTSSPAPRSGTYCLKLPWINSATPFTYSWQANFTPTSEIYFQFGVRRDGTNIQAETQIFAWADASGNVLGGFWMQTDFTVRVYVGTKTTLIGTLASYPTADWGLIEGRIVIGDSGVIQIKVNGSLIVDYSGDTKPGTGTTVAALRHGNAWSASANLYFDDIVVLDTTGGTLDSWPGGLRCFRLGPTGVGNYSQWTPTSGDNYACVDETPPDSADYVKSNTTGHKDSYVMANCPTDIKDIKAVVPRYWGQGGGQIKRLLRIGGSDYLSAALDFPIVGKLDNILYVSPVSPYDPFTTSELDGLESGMEKQ
jgi:hypothetical protein